MTHGITYTLGRSLFVALTNRCNSVSLIESRGPGFVLSASSGFMPLPDGFEPTWEEITTAVASAYTAAAAEPPAAVVFAGAGEPLLRMRVLEEAARSIATAHAPPAIRVNTNGLVAGSAVKDIATRLRGAGVTMASIALMSADEDQATPQS